MQLNETPLREKYKEFYGKNTEQMELLIKDKGIPLTMKQIIERRLNSKQPDWKDNYFDTCDSIAYGENRKFKIIKNCKILKLMNKDTKLDNGRIKITKKIYKNLKGKEFEENTPTEEIWKYLLKELYEPYIKMLGYCPEYYIYLRDFTLGAWCVGRLGGDGRSGASGRSYLDDDIGRLVGVASETQGEE